MISDTEMYIKKFIESQVDHGKQVNSIESIPSNCFDVMSESHRSRSPLIHTNVVGQKLKEVESTLRYAEIYEVQLFEGNNPVCVIML